jgi:transcriptional antiterminator NusG
LNAEENQKTVESEQTVEQNPDAVPDQEAQPVVQAARPEPAEPVLAQEIEPVKEDEPEVEPDAPETRVPAGEEPTASAPPAPPAAPAKPEETKRAWYVVHCYSGYENKVKKSLEQRITNMDVDGLIFRIIVPTEEEIDVREGQRKVIQRRVFPGYVLVEMMQYDPENPESKRAWYVVRNTPGVTGFVSSGDIPTPLREDEVSKILKRMETDQPKVRVTYRKGQVVHIIDGPFADFRGTVDEVNMEKGKVRVMVSFFGRDTPVELDLLQVEKV